MNTGRASAGGMKFGGVRYSAVELLIALVLLFVVTPFVQDLRHGQFVEALLFTLVLVSAVFAIGARGRTLRIAGVLCVAAAGARWTQHLFPEAVPSWAVPMTALLFLGYVVLQLLRFILSASEVNAEVLCAAIAAFLLLGLVWALNYLLVARLSPNAFAFSTGPGASQTLDSFTAFYFSFTVLSTVGFGDITPISREARMLAITEAVTGMFYVTILIARLVAMYSPGSKRDAQESSKPS